MNSVNPQTFRERDRHEGVPVDSWQRIDDPAWRHQDPYLLERRKLKGEDACQGLRDAVSESRWILELPDDWDNEGACSYREETWVRAKEFLFRLAAVESEKTFNFLIPLPRILPGPDGSIDLHWKTDNYELLVNIPADGDQAAGFYGDDYGKMNIKGTFDPTKDTHCVLSWIKDR